LTDVSKMQVFLEGVVDVEAKVKVVGES